MSRFSFERELRFGDCDPSGIAYFPSYLDMLNGVVEEFWAKIGFPWQELITVRKIGTPTVHLDCDFSFPSLFGDRLTFELQVKRVGRASLQLGHVISGSDGTRWTANQILAATSLVDRRAIPWPDDVRAALVKGLEISADGARSIA
ncbi:4-hydroxybenzoyl-CoA thioesterase [Bradyrhizobium sp. USDA 4369]